MSLALMEMQSIVLFFVFGVSVTAASSRSYVPVYEPKISFSRGSVLAHNRPLLNYHANPIYRSLPNKIISQIYKPDSQVYTLSHSYNPYVTQIIPQKLSFRPRIRTYKAKAAYEPLYKQEQLYKAKPVYEAKIFHVPKPTHETRDSYELKPMYHRKKTTYEPKPEPAYIRQKPSYKPEPTYNLKPSYKPEPTYNTKTFNEPEPSYETNFFYQPKQSDQPKLPYEPKPLYKHRPAYEPTLSNEKHSNKLEPLYKKDDVKPYSFDYGVKDDYTGADFGHSETSDGNGVKGSYTVALPDGRIQKVTYTADEHNGFQAVVTYEGEATYPKQVPYSKPVYEPELEFKPEKKQKQNLSLKPKPGPISLRNQIPHYNTLPAKSLFYSPFSKHYSN